MVIIVVVHNGNNPGSNTSRTRAEGTEFFEKLHIEIFMNIMLIAFNESVTVLLTSLLIFLFEL